MSGASLLAVVTAGLFDSVFRRMFLLGGNTRSGPEPSLEPLSAFVWEELIFLSHNIKPPIFVGLGLFVPGRSHLGEEGGEEETSFGAQHGGDTQEASALLTEAWIGRTKCKSTLSVQSLGNKWFHKPGFSIIVIFPPQGSPFQPLKVLVPMGNTMENREHC